MNNAQAARETLAVLGEGGWCKMILQASGGGWLNEPSRQRAHCLGGAMNMADHGHWMWPRASSEAYPAPYAALAEIIREQYPDRLKETSGRHVSSVIADFNNHYRTTLGDVETVLGKLEAAGDDVS